MKGTDGVEQHGDKARWEKLSWFGSLRRRDVGGDGAVRFMDDRERCRGQENKFAVITHNRKGQKTKKILR